MIKVLAKIQSTSIIVESKIVYKWKISGLNYSWDVENIEEGAFVNFYAKKSVSNPLIK